MKGNVVEVRIWDKTVGLLSWDEKRRCSVFQFDKNFSFVMDQDGKWKLSPAYDLIFSADLDYRIYQSHELSI